MFQLLDFVLWFGDILKNICDKIFLSRMKMHRNLWLWKWLAQFLTHISQWRGQILPLICCKGASIVLPSMQDILTFLIGSLVIIFMNFYHMPYNSSVFDINLNIIYFLIKLHNFELFVIPLNMICFWSKLYNLILSSKPDCKGRRLSLM